MEIRSKYSIGDKVYRAGIHRVKQSLPCPDCLGQHKWKATSPAGDEFEFDCPRCRSSDSDLVYYNDSPVITKLTIGSVRVNTSDKERTVAYMCNETGVGSGSIYDEEDLFPTEDQAFEAANIKAQYKVATDPDLIARYNKTLSLHTYQLSGKQNLEFLAKANFCPSPKEREAWEAIYKELPIGAHYQSAVNTLNNVFIRELSS